MMNIKVGQGFSYKTRRNKLAFGLVVATKNNQASWVSVVPVYSDGVSRKFYDSSDAVYERDRNHVHLTDCPPPFSYFGTYDNFRHEPISNVLAVADIENCHHISFDVFSDRCQIIDDGVQISDKDMETVFSHPWQSRRQKEKLISDMSELNLDDVHQDFSFQ